MAIIPCLGAVAYAYSEDASTTPQLSLSLNAGEIAEVIFTFTCGGKLYGDVTSGMDPNYKWNYNVLSGDIQFLSFAGGDFQIPGYVDNCLTTTLEVSTLIQSNTTGPVSLSIGGNIPKTCFTNSNWCLFGKVIAKSFDPDVT